MSILLVQWHTDTKIDAMNSRKNTIVFFQKSGNLFWENWPFLTKNRRRCPSQHSNLVAVEPAGTTKECASCGVSTNKPLWVREHSCPACGFTADRDANAALYILSRGITKVGVGHSESTPVETALPVDTSVSAKRVVEAGSPTLKRKPSGER